MRFAVILTVFIVLLTSCSNYQTAESTIPSVSETFSQTTINSTNTKTPTKLIPTSTLPPIIIPSPTPYFYTVVLNDTLIGIAFKFNIPIEALLEANPSFSNQPLIVGQELIIPVVVDSEATPTITPFPLQISQLNCLNTKDASLTCLVLVKNEYTGWIQNLSVLIQLIDPSGKEIDSCNAYPVLDLVQPGSSMVLNCSFQNTPIGNYKAYATIISAVNNPLPGDLYLNLSIQNSLVEINWDGLSASVHGKVSNNTKNQDARRVWILAIAFNKEGTVIGFRRWESTTTLTYGGEMLFELNVAALDSEIDQVELVVEGTK